MERLSISAVQRGSQTPCLLLLTKEIYFWVGSWDVISAPNNLQSSSHYPSCTTNTMSWRSLVSNLEPFCSWVNPLSTTLKWKWCLCLLEIFVYYKQTLISKTTTTTKKTFCVFGFFCWEKNNLLCDKMFHRVTEKSQQINSGRHFFECQ